MAIQLDEHIKDKVFELCKNIAGSRQIIAACIYGPWVCGYADSKTDINVLLILDSFPLRINTYFETIDDVNVSVLTINRSDFERDVNNSWLGEFFAEKVTAPYASLKNGDYLRLHEVKTKKRTVLELLKNLISEFPESSHEFLIKKEYFMYAVMMRKARVFPPLTYSFLNMIQGNLGRKNLETIMEGYLEALEELKNEEIILQLDGYIKLTKSFINSVKKRKSKVPLFIKSIQRRALPPLLSVYSDAASSFIMEQRLFMKNSKKVGTNQLVSKLEDPKKHVLLPTPLGLISLSDKSEIEDVARQIIPEGEFSRIKVKSIGGVLNDVYILTITHDNKERKFVVKRFLDWSNLKWLSLTMWSLGTTTFSVSGQSRLEKEYAINAFLRNKNFPVPKIFYISHQKRLIFKEFIEGEELVKPIRRIIATNKTTKDVALMKEVGRKLAAAHSLGISLGDCKPENFIVTKDGIVLLYLEQATREGNYTWDIAEFLYYSGHYSPPMSSTHAATIIARSFLEGYLEAGGKKEIVKNAASARYTKVFSVFTPPHILLAISSLCQKMGKEVANKKS